MNVLRGSGCGGGGGGGGVDVGSWWEKEAALCPRRNLGAQVIIIWK
jgi:hypothetical protein